MGPSEAYRTCSPCWACQPADSCLPLYARQSCDATGACVPCYPLRTIRSRSTCLASRTLEAFTARGTAAACDAPEPGLPLDALLTSNPNGSCQPSDALRTPGSS